MKTSITVFLTEADAPAREILAFVLKKEGHMVRTAATVRDTLNGLVAVKPDILVLDKVLPDGDGLKLVMQLRKDPALSKLPVIMTGGKGGAEERVLGLRLGADDYLSKPFDTEELLARIDALVRRSRGAFSASARIASSGIVLDMASRGVLADGNEVSLSPKEFVLLKALVERAGTVLSRQFILDTVWGSSPSQKTSKLVDVTVMNIRRKLGRAGSSIIAVRAEGYLLPATGQRGGAGPSARKPAK